MNQKIFLFGCWNKNQCLEGAENDPRKEVLELLPMNLPNMILEFSLEITSIPIK